MSDPCGSACTCRWGACVRQGLGRGSGVRGDSWLRSRVQVGPVPPTGGTSGATGLDRARGAGCSGGSGCGGRRVLASQGQRLVLTGACVVVVGAG